MNNIRAMLSGKTVPSASVLSEKKPSRAPGDGLSAVSVPREATRTVDHRGEDRHRLTGEQAVVLFKQRLHPVTLINLSGGGAMIEGDFKPRLWDQIELNLGEHGSIDCAVRWIRNGRYGLEFAHETQVFADPDALNSLLVEVISRSFPEIAQGSSPEAIVPAAIDAADPTELAARRTAARHPMIWSGLIHYSHDSYPVRLRNISAQGAMVESAKGFPLESEVYLDLGEAGSLFASVSWVHGDQVGLSFAQPFDVANLAKHAPSVAPSRWLQPEYLRDANADSSPWASQWGRLSVEELKRSLEGFIRH